MLLALVGAALGGSVCPDLRLQPRAAPLTGYACQTLSESLVLCAACGDQLVLEEALPGWGLDTAGLHALLGERGAEVLSDARPARQEIPDMPGAVFWMSQVNDGWDAAALLHPDRLREQAGTTPVLGIPTDNTLLFWIPGDAEIDTIMAVGVRRMYEAAARPVSDKIYRWHNGAWVVWGEVQASEP